MICNFPDWKNIALQTFLQLLVPKKRVKLIEMIAFKLLMHFYCIRNERNCQNILLLSLSGVHHSGVVVAKLGGAYL